MSHDRIHGIWRLVGVGWVALCCCSCAGRQYYREIPHAAVAKNAVSGRTVAWDARGGADASRRPPAPAGLSRRAEDGPAGKDATRQRGFKRTFGRQIFDIARRMGIDLEGGESQRLLLSMDRWLGTPYRWGGCDESGIDCSCLVRRVFGEAFGIDMERTVQDMERDDLRPVNRRDLRMGDLVFFRIFGSRVNHIGIYLKGGKFFHASQSTGVRVSDLDSPYYRGTFARAGRVSAEDAPAIARMEIDGLVVRH